MSRMSIFWLTLAIMGGGVILLLLSEQQGQTLGLPSDVFGGLIFCAVLALAVGAGILRSRIPMGSMARDLAAWVLAVLVLIAGYQYRYELQDVASRISAGLIPGSPLSVTDADGRSTVTLDKLSNGHFGARVSIDGTTVQMLVDTGASSTVLTESDASRAGFDTQKLSYNIPISTANGMTRAALVTAGNIAVGAIVRHDLPVLVADSGTLDQSLLGMNFIGTLSGFDVRGDRMILRD
jgi:aspartyl protease family protein